jgi:hypothetical protein
MTREKRYNIRKKLTARVRLSHSTFGVIHARTRNISDTGVFVELINQPHLPIGAHLKMHMLDSALPKLAFNMKVVRTDSQGISMKFVDYEEDGIRYPIKSLEQVWRQQSK